MKKYILNAALLFSMASAQAQLSDTSFFAPAQPGVANDLLAPQTDRDNGNGQNEDNFLNQANGISANGPGNGRGNGNGNGIGNGNGNGLGNNPNNPIDPGPDPGIPVDGGILALLAAGILLGGGMLWKQRQSASA